MGLGNNDAEEMKLIASDPNAHHLMTSPSYDDMLPIATRLTNVGIFLHFVIAHVVVSYAIFIYVDSFKDIVLRLAYTKHLHLYTLNVGNLPNVSSKLSKSSR